MKSQQNAAKGRGRGRKPRGLVESTMILPGSAQLRGSNFEFQYFLGFQIGEYFLGQGVGGIAKLDYICELFINILVFFKVKIQNWNFFMGVANFQLFLGVCLIHLLYLG